MGTDSSISAPDNQEPGTVGIADYFNRSGYEMTMTTENQENLSPLELQLASALKPVRPSQGFVNTTRRKFTFASPTIVAQRVTDKNFLIILLASSLGAALAVFSLARLFFYLSGRSKQTG
jgi:hypothetical protein